MATRYWVGGSGTWNSTNTANWSTTSGGAGGASVPTNADTPTFNTSSGSGVVTISGDVPAYRVTISASTANIYLNCPTTSDCISLYSDVSTTPNISCGAGCNTSTSINVKVRTISTHVTLLSISSGITINNLEILGSSTGQTRLTSPGSGITWYVNNFTHTTTGGTVYIGYQSTLSPGTIAGSGTWTFGKNVTFENRLQFTGNLIFTSGTYTVSNYASTDTSASKNFGNITTYKSTAVPVPFYYTTPGTYGPEYCTSMTVKSGAVQSNAYGGISGNVTVDGGTATYDTISGVATINSGSLTISTQCFGLTTSTSSAKTITLGSSVNCYGPLYIGGSNTTWAGGSYLSLYSTTITVLTQNQTVPVTLNLNSSGFVVFSGAYELTLNGTTASGSNKYIQVDIPKLKTTNTMDLSGSPTSGYRNIIFTSKGTQAQLVSNNDINLNHTDLLNMSVSAGTNVYSTGTGDCGGNSGVTFSTPVTRYLVCGAGGTKYYNDTNAWSTSSGGATGASVPLAHDIAIFDANSGNSTSTLHLTQQQYIPASIQGTTFPGVVRSYSSSPSEHMLCMDFEINRAYAGDFITLGITGIGAPNRKLRVIDASTNYVYSHTILNNSTTTGPSNWKLTGNLSCYILSSTKQNIDLNSYTITVSNSGGVISPKNSWGTGTLKTTSVNSFQINSGASANLTGVTLETTNDTTIYLENYVTLGKLLLSGSTTGTIHLNLNTSSSINEVVSTKTGAYTLWCYSNSSSECGISKWSVSGSAGNLVTIRGIYTYLGSGVVSANYLNVLGSTATPSNTWYAGKNSIDAGSNTGWIFTDPPTGGGLFFGSNF